MELILDPVIPERYKSSNGKYLYSKGYHNRWKGMTMEERYGLERAASIKKKMSHARRKRINYHKPNRVTPVVVIHQGKLIAQFSSTKEAERKTGIDNVMISRYLRQGVKPRNGWKWFYEKDFDKWRKELSE